MPQLWDEYCTGDPETIRLQRMGDIRDGLEKRKAEQATARKSRAEAKAQEALANARRTGRKRKRTSRSQVGKFYVREQT